jgi:hypothetical protein
MTKKIYIFTGIIILFVGLLIYLDSNERNSSFATPQEALGKVEKPSWEVIEVIDTRIYEGDKYAYVFFYSQMYEPKDYFVVSEFEKGKYGWKYVKMFGGGGVKEPNYNAYNYVGGSENGLQYGVAGSDTVSVERGNREAELIPLNKNNIKIWFLYKPTPEQEKEELMFYDKNGNLLN